MKKTFLLIVLAALPLSLYSQQKPAVSGAPERAAQPQQADEDEAGVMIDGTDTQPAPEPRTAPDGDSAEPLSLRDPNALPASLGDVKGTFADAGRNILVLQADDGTVNFVQVTFGRTGVSWKPAGSLYRSRE